MFSRRALLLSAWSLPILTRRSVAGLVARTTQGFGVARLGFEYSWPPLSRSSPTGAGRRASRPFLPFMVISCPKRKSSRRSLVINPIRRPSDRKLSKSSMALGSIDREIHLKPPQLYYGTLSLGSGDRTQLCKPLGSLKTIGR